MPDIVSADDKAEDEEEKREETGTDPNFEEFDNLFY
jgi:hypothetical protein